ncbi:MAG: Cyanate permease [Chloroflexi bacterium]|nr:MAG: Cyanate permease [Chloroflexota bacterium]
MAQNSILDTTDSNRTEKNNESKYGWAIVAVIFASMGVAIGTGQYAFGVFVEPLEAHYGWSRIQINTSLSFFAIGSLSAPLVGRLMDKIGTKPVMGASLILFSISYLLRPFMTNIFHWYLVSIVQFVGMPGSAMLPAGKLIGAWFPKRTGRMLGISMMGANFGGVIMPIFASLLVSSYGWQYTYTTFGFLCLATALGALFFIKDDPLSTTSGIKKSNKTVQNGATVRQALHSRSFYAVVLGVMAASFTYQSVLTQIIPHLQNEGMTIKSASAFLGVVAAFGMLGKIAFGILTERLASRYVLMIALLFQILGLVILVSVPTSNLVWIATPIYGMALGGTGVIMAILAQQTFGLKHFGTIFGLINMATAASALLGPIMVGATFDTTGSYRFAFVIVAFIFGLGILFLRKATPIVQIGQDLAENTVSPITKIG